MVNQRLHQEARIRSSPAYARFVGVSIFSGGRVKSCTRRISLDPIGFRVRWWGFRPVSSDR
jgi:hypothetical protein